MLDKADCENFRKVDRKILSEVRKSEQAENLTWFLSKFAMEIREDEYKGLVSLMKVLMESQGLWKLYPRFSKSWAFFEGTKYWILDFS